MKKFSIITILIACCFSYGLSQTQEIIFYENFDSTSISSLSNNWTQEKVVGSTLIEWTTKDGGHQGNPPSAYQGENNAFFQYQSYNGETTKLITPELVFRDTTEGNDNIIYQKPELRFAHAQDIWIASGNDWWDKLKVYYKRGVDSAWVLLEEYLDPVTSWTEHSILLPDSSLSSTYYIAFEGITGYGHGVCIDSVRIVETGVIAKYLESIEINQASTSFIATGTSNNPILRIDLNVMGNDGALLLDSIAVQSLNTSDSDITPDGVQLFATTSSTFTDDNLLSSGNFDSGLIIFDDVNYDIPRGYSYLWITYDIKEDINHELHGHIADAKIDANSININGYLFPYSNISPTGLRTIYESLIYDNFESDKNWRLTGEFEINTPLGKYGERGGPDPSEALSGENVLGTDLTDDGMYPNNLTDTAYVAEAPTLNCKYYKDIYLTFYRWLNIDLFDNARILVSTNNVDWNTLWRNESFYTDDIWTSHQFNLSSYFERKEQARLKFTLGPTNNINKYTGWNIEDMIIIGNYIAKDVGVSNWIAPVSGCGHTDEEYVEITISNYAGDPMTYPLPVSYSFDGGTTIKYDTINETIPVDGSINYTIDKPVDLTAPGWYNNIYATTHLAGDEDNSNNRFDTTLFITPTYTLPYSEDFETNYGYYLTGGTNSTWEYGTPAGTLIDTAASGTKAWVTNLDGVYSNNESSYIESPCFNFGGADSIIFEFKCIGISEDQTDGLTVMYSFNEGETWNPLPNDHDYYWNWYNEENITALGTAGIDTTNGEWLTFRQLLPAEFSNQSLVKFRFVFKSNASLRYEGFGIDDIKIYEAPYDVGVSTMTYPYNDCEWKDTTHVKVHIKNYGPTTVKAGTEIPLVMKFNSSTTKDTLTLSQDLAVEDSVLFTFNSTVDMSYAGEYDFTIYTKLENDSYFYNDTLSNDSLVTTVSVLGMPNYNPFPDLIGDEDATLTLDAGAGYTYEWQDASDLQTYNVTSEGLYSVTVTNGVGCTASDSVEVVASEIDLKLDSLYTEVADSCERTQLTEIKAHFVNLSINSTVLPVDSSYQLGYQINDLPIVTETITITGSDVEFEDTVIYTFNEKADFTEPGNYTLKVFTDVLKDLEHSNDSLTKTLNTWGYVEIDMAYDTIYSSQADTLKIGTTPGYTDYIWSTSETTDTITPPDNVSRWYKVTVSDINICATDSDSVYVETYDMGITAVTNPVNACEDTISASEDILVTVKNYSGNTYASDESINVYYNFDNSGWIQRTLTPGTSFTPNSSVTLNLDALDPIEPGMHTIKVTTSSTRDANHSNDTTIHHFETYPLPDVELAYDTIFTTQPDTVVLMAQEGFASYLWNNGETNDTLYVTDKTTQNYIVEVTDANGCGTDSDSTLIVTYNVGISSLNAPQNACEHTSNESVKITVKNYGQDTLTSGTQIPVGYIFDYGIPVHETLTLSTNLYPSGTANYTFNEKVDLSEVKTYHFKVYSDLKLDVKRTNDTIVDAFKTFGYPSIDLGDDIFTSQADTVLLIADPGYNNYTWNEGTKNDTLEINYPASYNYEVTVTDINGCSTIDDVDIYTYDISVASINSPTTTCAFTSEEMLNISIQNNSQDTLLAGETVDISYWLNGAAGSTETLTLNTDLHPDSTADYTFSSTIDLSSDTEHTIKVSCSRAIDVNDSNDTLEVTIQEMGYPEVNLGDDIYTTDPVGTILSVPAEYDTYLWQDGTTTADYTVSYPASNTYSVTVTDSYGCEGSDELDIYTYNVMASALATPVSQCEFTDTEEITITVQNSSLDTLLSDETISASYILNSGTPVTQTFDLTETLYPDNTVDFTFTQTADLSENQTHQFKLFAKLSGIDVDLEDTTSASVDFQKPVFDLGDDVNVGTNEYVIDAGAGFTSYLWYDGSTEQTDTVDINNQTPNQYYAVTVTNSFGCEAADSIKVIFDLQPDIAVTEMYSPEETCWIDGETYPVEIQVTNTGAINLTEGTEIEMGYLSDNGNPVTETYPLSSDLASSATFTFTFTDDISFPSGKEYTIKTFAKLATDGDNSNDTLSRVVNISAPDVNLSPDDTIYFEDQVTLNPGSWDEYLWQDGSTNQTYSVTSSGLYSVTVTDDVGCQASDEVYCSQLTGIDNLIQGDGYSITYFPNPVGEELKILINSQKTLDIHLDLINTHGQVIYNRKLSRVRDFVERIYVNNYAQGVYYLRFRIDEKFYIRKIIIQ